MSDEMLTMQPVEQGTGSGWSTTTKILIGGLAVAGGFASGYWCGGRRFRTKGQPQAPQTEAKKEENKFFGSYEE